MRGASRRSSAQFSIFIFILLRFLCCFLFGAHSQLAWPGQEAQPAGTWQKSFSRRRENSVQDMAAGQQWQWQWQKRLLHIINFLYLLSLALVLSLSLSHSVAEVIALQ